MGTQWGIWWLLLLLGRMAIAWLLLFEGAKASGTVRDLLCSNNNTTWDLY
jgi:hypothetical protein